MWNLKARGARGTPFVELGRFASILEAVGCINKYEGVNESEAVFLEVRVLPYWRETRIEPTDDSGLLSRLEYQTERHYYLLTRINN